MCPLCAERLVAILIVIVTHVNHIYGCGCLYCNLVILNCSTIMSTCYWNDNRFRCQYTVVSCTKYCRCHCLRIWTRTLWNIDQSRQKSWRNRPQYSIKVAIVISFILTLRDFVCLPQTLANMRHWINIKLCLLEAVIQQHSLQTPDLITRSVYCSVQTIAF